MVEILKKTIVFADQVTVSYGDQKPVLDQISFSLMPKTFHFVTGASGSGKTTLLKLLSLSQKPTKGRLTLFSKDRYKMAPSEIQALRQKIGIVFQDFRLFPYLTALENVALPLKLQKKQEGDIFSEAKELLDWVGLSHQMNAYPHTLSGGEQQRVAIARAIITKPHLLLADEPTGNVDDMIALKILRLFEELNKIGTTILIATHNDHMVTRFPYPRFHLEAGKLSSVGMNINPEVQDYVTKKAN